ncbi:hypothetical protein AQJ66_31395 [Streptomyces bungoensis]|uniref:Uncharacterized protein n=1 Tax=Streptomyces bungoensis TaxID=285568 RepID=A0A101SQE7_9ACTN|nr:hypothetical protein [Streptomyces bungoensis]KUN78250.1 hypothetical protein AQJ66_31395 [Streptomyces bungoensis]
MRAHRSGNRCSRAGGTDQRSSTLASLTSAGPSSRGVSRTSAASPLITALPWNDRSASGPGTAPAGPVTPAPTATAPHTPSSRTRLIRTPPRLGPRCPAP